MLLFSLPYFSHAQNAINWLSFDAATQKNTQQPRKIMVKIYAEDCTWCKRMDEMTLNQKSVIDYVNTNFYAVQLNADSKEPILFRDKTYEYTKRAGRSYHELAAFFTNGNLSYPTIVFLDENLGTIQAMSGYKDLDMFHKILTYFSKNYHKTIPWSDYQSQYNAFQDNR
jgi:thioredoxin-related protein